MKILDNGDIQGGYVKMIISLIDFSFVRSLTTSCYSIKSPPAYDPVSLFLLELFRYIDQHQNMNSFLKVLRDKDRGRAYRSYAGLCEDRIPSRGTFSNFKARLGESLYNDIFHVLVDVFRQLQSMKTRLKIITNTEQIRAHHDCQTKIDIADAKYDTIENYACLREKGSIPIID